MIKKIDHFVITVKDLNATVTFYEKLGFRIKDGEGRYELFGGDFKINVHLLGSELMPHAKYIQAGSADFCFEIDSGLEDFKQSLEDKGIITELGIVTRTGVWGAMSSIYLRDPDKNLIEFCSYKR